ncbi:TetR family transcriptional regulator, partial [Rhodococcus sp. (in: high G+C Gram-positive bacteria)]|uniref:TetR/AcrR family transcriptional regulator n=1 Tax=Rhodococcus sp. TaxID=1831 RepID=UPI0033145264
MTKAMTRAERKKAELRREIIDASFECFAKRGYHATGIADIATTLGIGHGTFYRYFENKRDIIDHVIDDLIAKIISALAVENAPDAANTLDEYRAQVGRIAEALPRIFFDDPRIPRVLLFETTGVDADLIREASRAYAAAKPAHIAWGLAIDQKSNGVQSGHCILALQSITGN